jgi:hypothetical protein
MKKFVDSIDSERLVKSVENFMIEGYLPQTTLRILFFINRI